MSPPASIPSSLHSPLRRCPQRPFLSSFVSPLSSPHTRVLMSKCPHVLVPIFLSSFVSRLSPLVSHPPSSPCPCVLMSPCPSSFHPSHPSILSSQTLLATSLHSLVPRLSSLVFRPCVPLSLCPCFPLILPLPSLRKSLRRYSRLFTLVSQLSTFNFQLSSLPSRPSTSLFAQFIAPLSSLHSPLSSLNFQLSTLNSPHLLIIQKNICNFCLSA